MSPPEDSVLAGASQRATGSKVEGGVGCGRWSWMQKVELDAEGGVGCGRGSWAWKVELDVEGGVGHGGVSVAKAAEANCQGVRDEGRANYSRGAPRALGVAQRCAGAPEELTGGTEGAPVGRCSSGIGNG